MGVTIDKILGEALDHEHDAEDILGLHDALTIGTNTAGALSLSDQELSLDDVFVQNSGDNMSGKLAITVATQTTQALQLKTSDDDSTNNLFEILDSSNTVLSWFKSNGELKLSIFSNTAQNPTGTTPIFFQGAVNQTAPLFVTKVASSGMTGNLYEAQDSGGGVMNLITTDGRMSLRYIGAQSATLAVGTGWSGYRGIIVRGASGQAQNLQEWQNNSSSILCAIHQTGAFTPVSLIDSSAPNNSIYYSTTQSKLVYKDGGGTVNNLY